MEGEARRASIPHISALDGSRGLAVAGVVLFHAAHLRGGYLGVDFFFTLSGFLITSLLLAESTRTGSVGLGGFWSRRARRLLPALGVVMIGVALYSALLAEPSELGQIRGDAFTTLFYVANWHEILSHTSYLALFSAASPLNHTWSLAIEEQFYLIWPLVFVALLAGFRRATPKAVLVAALAIAAASSALMIALYSSADTNRDYFGTDTRAASILFGAALAAALAAYGPAKKRNARVALEALGILGVVVLAVAWTRLDGESSTLYHGGFLLCGLAATAIIAAAVHPQRGPIARVLSFTPLCALGIISYGVYLYHWPIDVALNQGRVHLTGWPLAFVQFVVTLAIAIASYKLVEEPIRHGRLTGSQLRKVLPAGAAVVTIALFATTTGAPTSSASSLGENQSTPTGRTVTADATIARNAAPRGSERILLVGNSVARILGPAFQSLSKHLPVAAFDAGINACGFPPQIQYPSIKLPRLTIPRTPCHPSWESAVVQRFQPAIVFWIYDEIPQSSGTYLGRSAPPCSSTYAAVYRKALTHEVSVLGATGATVVITTSPYSRLIFTTDDRGDDCANQLKREVAASTGARLVDLFSFICPHGRCRSKQNGVTLRADGFHYEGAGGEIVARWLYDQVHRTRSNDS